MDNSRPIDVRRVNGARSEKVSDHVAVEEPLEIRVNGDRISVTMRTPGHDFDLAAGFLMTEGLVSAGDIGVIGYCRDANDNIVDVKLVEGAAFDPETVKRNFYATSSCGICGVAAIEQVRKRVPKLDSPLRMSRGMLLTLPGRLRAGQEVFERTGGLHASGLFTAEGSLDMLREDVGRHNAVDKVVGAMAVREKLPLSRHTLMVSGRSSFEIVQKAGVAGIPIVCAVSAPSSLAVEFARETGMTLVGFLRGDSFNVYAGEERIVD